MLGHYSATKWSIRGVTQAPALELAKQKITVNTYCPVNFERWCNEDHNRRYCWNGDAGYNIIEPLAKYEHKDKWAVIEDFSKKKLIAIERTSVPDDVANIVSYLAGKDSDYMTGQSIIIDGGIQFS